ncbi:hypothetical protein ACFYPT_37795 [Streptomyces sp. NPDC005529]|uniref:hypothetical protein n=1 Tax=unclassified Streptomyces TaxID=2593676 RepID=UPI0033B949E7
MTTVSVVVYPPDEEGARDVRADGVALGRALNVHDIAALLEAAGLRGLDEADVARSTLIEWLGGGPEVWTR